MMLDSNIEIGHRVLERRKKMEEIKSKKEWIEKRDTIYKIRYIYGYVGKMAYDKYVIAISDNGENILSAWDYVNDKEITHHGTLDSIKWEKPVHDACQAIQKHIYNGMIRMGIRLDNTAPEDMSDEYKTRCFDLSKGYSDLVYAELMGCIAMEYKTPSFSFMTYGKYLFPFTFRNSVDDSKTVGGWMPTLSMDPKWESIGVRYRQSVSPENFHPELIIERFSCYDNAI